MLALDGTIGQSRIERSKRLLAEGADKILANPESQLGLLRQMLVSYSCSYSIAESGNCVGTVHRQGHYSEAVWDGCYNGCGRRCPSRLQA